MAAMPSRFPWILGWTLASALGLAGCVTAQGQGSLNHYALDSVSTACARAPASCATLTGKESASASGVATTVVAGVVSTAALAVLTPGMQGRIQEELQKCAESARSEVLLRHAGTFKNLTPSNAECHEWTLTAQGRRISWAMRLGSEMHEAAFACVRAQLDKLRPGGYSIEPCYRYDMQTGKTTFISCSEAQTLLESGCGSDLKGTIKPDVVIHTGDPLKALATYDFKFPCVSSDVDPKWTKYPPDHPCYPLNQMGLYKAALGPIPVMIFPRWGAQ